MAEANVFIYDNPEIWSNYGDGRDAESARVEYVLENIPPDVTTVADIGCGSGVILNRLTDKLAVGVDGSSEALRHVLAPRALSNVSSLPLKSNAFDLVISCEVLEHLPDEVLAKAVDELSRITRRYLLITVPYRENLSLHTLKCPDCGSLFHRNGHVHSFDIKKIERLFNGMRVLKAEEFGPLCSRYREGVISRLQKLGLCHGDPTATATCPFCACTSFFSPTRFDRRVRNYARKFAGLSLGQQRNWIMLLFEKINS